MYFQTVCTCGAGVAFPCFLCTRRPRLLHNSFVKFATYVNNYLNVNIWRKTLQSYILSYTKLLLIGSFLTRVSFYLRASVQSYTRIGSELCASVTVSLLLIGSFPTRVSFYLRSSVQSYAHRFRATRVCNTFLASDWFFSYARKFSCTRVGSELRASILSVVTRGFDPDSASYS